MRSRRGAARRQFDDPCRRHRGRRSRHAVTVLAAVAAVVPAAAACGGGSAAAGGDTLDLAGRTYASTQVTGHELVPQTEVRLDFGEGTVSAHAGCNTFTGGATWDDGVLRVDGAMATSMMACSDDLVLQDDWLEDLLLSEPPLRLDVTTLVVGEGTQTLTLVEE